MNVDSPVAAHSDRGAMDFAPVAARGPEESTLATELTHVMHSWLADLQDSADRDRGTHRSVAPGP